jgi:hypothetical protein
MKRGLFKALKDVDITKQYKDGLLKQGDMAGKN